MFLIYINVTFLNALPSIKPSLASWVMLTKELIINICLVCINVAFIPDFPKRKYTVKLHVHILVILLFYIFSSSFYPHKSIYILQHIEAHIIWSDTKTNKHVMFEFWFPFSSTYRGQIPCNNLSRLTTPFLWLPVLLQCYSLWEEQLTYHLHPAHASPLHWKHSGVLKRVHNDFWNPA